MNIEREEELYPHIREWFERFLKDRHKRSRVEAHDTHKINLSNFLQNSEIHKFFPEFSSYDIKVDITGVILSTKSAKLAFVECKIKAVTLRDLGQLLGYSRVAKPDYSFLISPEGISAPLNILLQTFGRYDVLEYGDNLRIKIAKWNMKKMEIDSNSLLPPGDYF